MDQSVDRRQVLKLGAGAAVAAVAVAALPDHADAAPKPPAKKPIGSVGIVRLWGYANKKKGTLKTKSVWSGTDKKTLDKGGLCHWIGTAQPFAKGNSVLFGHRTSAGGLLRYSDRMVPGDRVVLSIGGITKTYAVVELPVVIGNKDFAQAINWGDKSKSNITLVACTKPNKKPTSTKFRLLIRCTEV